MNQIQGADWKIPVQFEFTRRYTPQQNHLAEVGFAAIAGCGRVTISATKVPKCYCEILERRLSNCNLFGWINSG
jgi:hypothetical protein